MMLDKVTLNRLRAKFGTEVTDLQVTYALEAGKATAVKDEYLKLLEARGIPDTEVMEWPPNSTEPYLVIAQQIKPGERTATAARIVSYGNDLLVELRHYEKSKSADSKRVLIMSGMLTVGCLFVWTGLGLLILLVGIGFIFAKSHFPESSPEREASHLLWQTVLETLSTALINCEVDPAAQLTTDF